MPALRKGRISRHTPLRATPSWLILPKTPPSSAQSIVASELRLYLQTTAGPTTFEPFHVLLPIPQDDMGTNPALEQNPGY